MNPAAIYEWFADFRRFSIGRRVIEPHAVPLYGLCLAGVLLIAAAVISDTFDYDAVFITNLLQSTFAMFSFIGAARWIGFGGIADGVEQVLLLFVSGIICAFCAVICASTAAPLADAALLRADMLVFGVNRTHLIADLHLSASTFRLWTFAYDSFAVTPVLAMVLLILNGQRWRAWALLTAMMACAAAMVAFLLVTPAFGTPPYPYAFESILAGVRSGQLRVLDTSVITGIVTFPSMHAADAVILAIAFGWLGRWATPLIVLNVFMFFSALIVGGHYAVDLIAGGCVGGVCIAGSVRLHQWLDAECSHDMDHRLSAKTPVILQSTRNSVDADNHSH